MQHCLSQISNDTKTMMDHNSGTIAKIKNKKKKCSFSHCVLHRYSVISRKMSSEDMIVLNHATEIAHKNTEIAYEIVKGDFKTNM